MFEAPQVRGLIREAKAPGTGKRQTRRLIKPQPPAEATARFAIGDRLWVRERCRAEELPDTIDPVRFRGKDGVRYAADDAFLAIEGTRDGVERWLALRDYRKPFGGLLLPALYMPRWASRLTLTITNVRVQRLQAITPADAIAEGIAVAGNSLNIDCDTPNPVDGYRNLWNGINQKRGFGWDTNPWVVALTFTVAMGNIDAPAAA